MGHDHQPERIPTNRGTPTVGDPPPQSALDAFMQSMFGATGIGNAEAQDRIGRVRTPSPNAPAPPGSTAPPGPGDFAPLTGADLTGRQGHGMSTDAGPMVESMENILFPAPGPGGTCVTEPATLRNDLGAALGTALAGDVPSLTPTAAADPMAVSADAAAAGMPLITSHYAPYAPSVSPGAFMSGVSVKPVDFADDVRTTDDVLAEFLEWYASDNATTRGLISGVCGLDRAWWETYTTWLMGTAHESTHQIRERSALFDTFNTTVAGTGTVELGRAFSAADIPGTIIHEAMHHFEHGDLEAQVGRLEDIRMTTDIFTEGMAEYLARPVADLTVDAMVGASPPTLDPALGSAAKTHGSYQHYVDQVVALRDLLYEHGQDGEDAIQRAFFLGEGWRFGLLEGPDEGSPVESDRPVPPTTDVHFDTSSTTANDLASLTDLVDYLKGRSIATVEIIGRTDPVGRRSSNDALGTRRAEGVKIWLEAQGIDSARITVGTRGERDQIRGGRDANRRASVTVTDARNTFATRL